MEAITIIHMGELIQKRRLERRMGPTELAGLAQVTVGYIRAIEAGRGGTYFDKIVRIAKVLHIDIRELVDIVLKN